MQRRRFFQMFSMGVLGMSLGPAALLPRKAAAFGGQAANSDPKVILNQINALRADPSNARATVEGFLAAAFPDAAARADLLKENTGNGKTHGQNLDVFVTWLKTQPTSPPLQWDDDLAAVSVSGGKSSNDYLKPDHWFGALDGRPAFVLIWPILRNQDNEYKPLFAARLRYGGAGLNGDKMFVTVSALKGKAFTRSDEEVGKNAYDPRFDDAPPWVHALSLREPNIISFVKTDGTLDVAWRALGSKQVFISRYSATGAKTWTKPVPGVDAGEYPLLMGFTEDAAGNLYVVRCKDEPGPPADVAAPKDNANNAYDRSDLVKATKLDANGGEVWTKDFAKKGGGAGAFFSPLSASGKGTVGASSRAAFTIIKRSTYRLAADESVVVPPEIAEECLLGYKVDRQGNQSPSVFDPKFQAAETGGILAPKVRLLSDDSFNKGKLIAADKEPGKPIEFSAEGGIPGGYHEIAFSPDEYEKFDAFIAASKKGEDKNQWIEPDKLKLKRVVDETPLLFLIYGAATDWDPQINGRHQNAYWRVLDTRTGEPVANMNAGAMGHSFDNRALVTDDGIITAERSDNFILLSNYLYTRPVPIFLPAFNSQSDGNESFTQIGGIAPADDGYLFLYAANNNPGQVAINRDTGLTSAQIEEAQVKQRDLGVLRVKKGFAQTIDSLQEKDEKQFTQLLDSQKPKTPTANALFLLQPKYITTYYPDKQPYSAGRPKIVRVADNSYVVFWERWTDQVTTNSEGKKERSGDYDSLWAMKIDKNGGIVKPAVKISDTARLMRGDDPVLWNGKAVWVSGDAAEDKLVLNTIDGSLTYQAMPLPL